MKESLFPSHNLSDIVMYANGDKKVMPMPTGAVGSKSWKRRQILYRKQNGICPYCDETLGSPENGTLDHIKPRSKGGRKTITNLCLVHPECNALKGSFSDYEEVVLFTRKLFDLFQRLKDKGFVQ